ncbi:MAG: patatin [Melioribacteraceae bacterium]|nr:MAG: patatin [Melioribacteraceae bacterium]
MSRIGVAFGAGGARGLAHITMYSALEELGITPSVISGTSIGAIFGIAYASGKTSKEIIEAMNDLIFSKNVKFWEFHKKNDWFKILELVDPSINSGGMIKGEKFGTYYADFLDVKTFEELKIKTKVVATNYWDKEEVVFDSGDLLSPVRASYSLPGLFTPIEIKSKLLVDGGMVNPLPFDLLHEECDITIALDVSAKKNNGNGQTPSAADVLFSTFQIMQNSIINEKLNSKKPDILIRADIPDIRMLEFNKAPSILKQAEIYKEELKRKLGELLY